MDGPETVNPNDAITEITPIDVCGSDLHLYDGDMPSMREGDSLGHSPACSISRR